jgi:hypothetical protein
MDPQAQTQDPAMGMPDQSQEEIMPYSPSPVPDGRPYFMGDHALIKFAAGEEGFGPETYWLVDKSNHTIRPFESHMALDAAFGSDLKQALQSAITVNPPSVDENGEIAEGVLQDFTILGPEYAIREDGTAEPLEFSSHQLKQRYGKPINDGLESLGAEVLEGFLNLMKTNEKKTDIPAIFVEKLKENHKLMAFYISALAYGDYTLGDIYSDVSRRYHHKIK